jgi:DNA-binding CsgD family transcriptional regulator
MLLCLTRVAELLARRHLRASTAATAVRLLGATHMLAQEESLVIDDDSSIVEARERTLLVLTVDDWRSAWNAGSLLSLTEVIQLGNVALNDASHHDDVAATETLGTAMLTSAERQVLVLVAQGSTNAEIAAHLHTSVATTRRHLQNVFVKLNVTNRTAAARAAVRFNLLGNG